MTELRTFCERGYTTPSRSIDRDRRHRPFRRVARWFIQRTNQPAQDSDFATVFWCFSRIKKLLGRTETRTREMMDRQSIRTA